MFCGLTWNSQSICLKGFKMRQKSLFEPRARPEGAGCRKARAAARARPAGTSRRRALPRAVAVSRRAVRRRFRRARAALCACVRACARGNDPSAGSPTETLLRLLLPLESQVWPSSRRPVTARRAGAAPCRAGPQSEGLTKPSDR